MRILFLDIDGPMIPWRAHMLTPGASMNVFDPVAVSLINKLLDDSGAKIVLSSTWRKSGLSYCALALSTNGIAPGRLHKDWATPCFHPSGDRVDRDIEIEEWLSRHPEVTHWVALDDDKLTVANFVRVTNKDGLMWKHYEELREFLIPPIPF